MTKNTINVLDYLHPNKSPMFTFGTDDFNTNKVPIIPICIIIVIQVLIYYADLIQYSIFILE